MLISYVAEFEMKSKQADLEKVSRMAWMWSRTPIECCLVVPRRNMCLTC